ncbi:MAG: transglycosylase SLT domain-containing protein [Phenylobacterium sp.]|uniref:lytic transglycosylase domain-containing protein n=1 Tax=Phenylobacterium sp. TaxID=1871053 RepID=UPI0025D30C3F|nr:lytic transglycosylase domain-containing protein [Phenylobacterium sp.]MBI1198940.1 transglycosylase SLT domain-containing protein [Phenylobacterium sp.]
MELSLADTLALSQQCAPAVAAETLLSVVQVESRFDPLAIGVNGRPRIAVRAATPKDAAVKASALIAQGRSVDLGLAQINSRNLDRLGLTVETAFDPCRNLAAAARLLQAGYEAEDDAQPALRRALSRYNTGDPRRGLINGYVAKVERAAVEVVPAIQALPPWPTSPAPPPADPQPASWDVFGQTGPAGFVMRVSAPGEAP